MVVETGDTVKQRMTWIGINLILLVIVFLPTWYILEWLATAIPAGFQIDHAEWATGILFFVMTYGPIAIAAGVLCLLLLMALLRIAAGRRLRAVGVAVSVTVLPLVILAAHPAIIRYYGNVIAIMAAAALFGLVIRPRSGTVTGVSEAQNQAGQV